MTTVSPDIATADRVATAPTAEPLDVDFTKKHLRFSTTSEDVLIGTWIAAARTHFEEQTGRQCGTSTREYALDGTPVSCRIEIPRPPLISVTAILYDDANGDEQTFDADNYRVLPSVIASDDPDVATPVDPYCAPGFVELVSGASWPSTNGLSRSLRIRYVCGYGDAADAMPPLIQGVLLLLVAHFHRNRSEVTEARGTLQKLPMGAKELIEAFKWSALPTHPPRRWICR